MQLKQLVSEVQLRQGDVQTVHPPRTAERNELVGHTQVFAAVVGNPSVHVRQFVADVTQVAHGEVQLGQEAPQM